MSYPKKRRRKEPLEKASEEWTKSLIKLMPREKKGRKQSKTPRRNKRLINFTQFIIATLALSGVLWKGFNQHSPPIPCDGSPPIFFCNQCDDDLRAVMVGGIQGANKTVDLHIYSLTDTKVVQTLNKKAHEGVAISIMHDADTSKAGFSQLGPPIEQIPATVSGLMHQKILIVDKEKVWIGSANLTPDSLRSHSNLVMGVNCPALAEKILETPPHSADFIIGEQWLEYWPLPEEKDRGLKRIITLLDGAQKTVQVAMFTFTHPDLTKALIKAHKRGVKVEALIDFQQGIGVCSKTIRELFEAHVPLRLSRAGEVVHHKFALIDEETLIHGSANWTKAAFGKNAECFVVLHSLKEEQLQKMDKLWKALKATSTQVKDLRILGKHTEIDHHPFKMLDLAA